MERPGSITKLEWVTCPSCASTFQIAVPSGAQHMRVSKSQTYSANYEFPIVCANADCQKEFWIETDLPHSLEKWKK